MEEVYVKHGKTLQTMHRQINDIAKKHRITPTLMDAQFMGKIESMGIRERLKAIVSAALKGEDQAHQVVVEEKIKPPFSSALYERIDKGSDIVDIGTGKGSRVSRYGSYFNSVVCVDPGVSELVEDFPKNWEYKREAFTATESVVTSFGLLSQLESVEVAVVESCDGVHIWPDQQKTISNGLAVDRDDGKIEVHMGKKIWVEPRNDWSTEVLDLDGVYSATNTYAKRELTFTSRARFKGQRTGGIYRRVVSDFPESNLSWKEDGVFNELIAKGGRAQLKQRDGRGLVLEGESPDMVLHLERMPDCYVLLRVVKYRKYAPYHSLSLLEKFVRRVKIKIDGRVIRAPRRVLNLDRPPEGCDGVVHRAGEQDFVYNFGMNLDLQPSQGKKLREFLKEMCVVDIDEDLSRQGDMNSVEIRINVHGIAKVKWVKRTDKIMPDSEDTWRKRASAMNVDRHVMASQLMTQTPFEMWDDDEE